MTYQHNAPTSDSVEPASNEKIDGQRQTICIYYKNEISVRFGGLDRASISLADILEKRNFRVVFLACCRRDLEHPLSQKQYIVPTEPQNLFADFMHEQNVKIFINQNGAVPFPYKGFDFKHEKVAFISVLHFNPFYYSRASLFDRLSRKPGFKLLPLPLKKALFMNPLSVGAASCAMRWHLRKNYRKIVSTCDRFVLLSETFKPELQKLLGVRTPPKNVCAIPNIVASPYEPTNVFAKKRELIWVGRVEFPQKRPDFMLRIWQCLQDRFPDWSLRFVGDGPYLQELKALAKELSVQRVFFEGFQDPALYYRSASIFCMTSAYEGFGLVLVEAQAFGCVPVAFESFSAVRDIIDDGVNGALVPAFDIEKYAEKLAELMSNPELRVRLATNAQKSIAKFTPEAIGDEWEKLLREVVGENPWQYLL